MSHSKSEYSLSITTENLVSFYEFSFPSIIDDFNLAVDKYVRALTPDSFGGTLRKEAEVRSSLSLRIFLKVLDDIIGVFISRVKGQLSFLALLVLSGREGFPSEFDVLDGVEKFDESRFGSVSERGVLYDKPLSDFLFVL